MQYGLCRDPRNHELEAFVNTSYDLQLRCLKCSPDTYLMVDSQDFLCYLMKHHIDAFYDAVGYSHKESDHAIR